VASEWIIGTGPNVKDPFKLRIRLLSENETVIQECERQVEASADWYEVKIELDVSRENGIRYIQWYEHQLRSFFPLLETLIVSYQV